MAMTVTEAIAINVLLRAIYGPRAGSGWGGRPTALDIDKAAATLADAAYRRLMAGHDSGSLPPLGENVQPTDRALGLAWQAEFPFGEVDR